MAVGAAALNTFQRETLLPAVAPGVPALPLGASLSIVRLTEEEAGMYTVWKARTQPFSLWVCPEKHVHLKIGSVVLELTTDELNALATLSKTVQLALSESRNAKITVTGH